MFFHVDESGNTGLHLFDETQPDLFYGLLSCKVNMDVIAEPHLKVLRQRLGVSRLHAADLGIGRLSTIAPDLRRLVRKHDVRFALYKVVKFDYAVIQFFDNVFDQGLNPAAGWATYWTPIRYVMLLKIASLIDEDLARKAWAARIEKNNEKSRTQLVDVCTSILDRIDSIPDERSKQLISDTLNWTIRNPDRINYNAESKSMQLAVSPNLVGFQFVLLGVAQRLRSAGAAMKGLLVDRQHQFNEAQAELSEYYSRASGHVQSLGPGLPKLDLRNMPDTGPLFGSSESSAGLELVDLFIWIFKRARECSHDEGLAVLMRELMKRGAYDELSLRAISARWEPYFKKLMDIPLGPDDLERAIQMTAQHEKLRLDGMSEKQEY